MPANVGRMFYYGEKPWHGLGHRLDAPANLEEALRYGDLDWEVELVDLKTVNGEPAPMRRAVVRPDPNALLPGFGTVLGVVHPGFVPLQNRQGAEVFDAIFGRGERVYHTGGYLGQGEVVWLLARLPAELTLAGNDIVEPYLLFSNSHNGTRAIDFRLTTVRVVCQNTLNLALSARGQTTRVFKRDHSRGYAGLQSEFEGFFKFTIAALKVVETQFQRLGQSRCSETAFQQFVQIVYPPPAPPAGDRPAAIARYEAAKQVVAQYQDGVRQRWRVSNDSAPAVAHGTWWAALNAVTAYVDHDQPTSRDRYSFMMFGQGDVIKQKAYRLATEMSGQVIYD